MGTQRFVASGVTDGSRFVLFLGLGTLMSVPNWRSMLRQAPPIMIGDVAGDHDRLPASGS